MTMASINPATGATLKTFEEHTPVQVEQKLNAAMRAFETHRKTTFGQRAERMQRVAEILAKEKQTFGRMMTEEMGKTLKSAIAEAEKCALACRHYAENAESYLERRSDRDRRRLELRALSAARPGARGHALELPVLAGDPLRRAGAGGRERGAAEARVERAAVRARARGLVPPRRLPRGRLPDAAHRLERVAQLIADVVSPR